MSQTTVNDALGVDPVQVGRRARAVPGSTAIGVDAETDHVNATAIGRNTLARGNDSTAIGSEARAPSNWNTVLGYSAGSAQNGNNVVAIGRKAEVQGDNAVAVGETARANALDATAIGRDAAALAQDATALGREAEATAAGAVAVGRGTTVGVAGSVGIGARDYLVESGQSVVYPAGTGAETLVSKPVDGSEPVGDPVGYSLDVGGTTVARVHAESDGAGGVQNARLVVPVSLAVEGATTEVDNTVTGDILIEDGAQVEQFRFDATAPDPLADINDNTLSNVGEITFPAVGGSPTFTGHNHAESGLTAIPNAGLANDTVTVSAGVGLSAGGSVALGGSVTVDHANTSSEGDLTAGAGQALGSVSIDQFGHVTGLSTTSFDSRYVQESGDTISGVLALGDDLQTSGGTTIYDAGASQIPQGRLENDTVTVSAGVGLSAGGSVALGGSTTLDHASTSSEGDLTAGAGAAIDSVSLDQFGHVTGLTTESFDTRYVRESGDTMSGALTVNNTVTANRVDVNGVGGSASTDGSKGIGAPSVYTNIVEAQSETGALSTYIQLSSGGPKSVTNDEIGVITDGEVQTVFNGEGIQTEGELTENKAL